MKKKPLKQKEQFKDQSDYSKLLNIEVSTVSAEALKPEQRANQAGPKNGQTLAAGRGQNQKNQKNRKGQQAGKDLARGRTLAKAKARETQTRPKARAKAKASSPRRLATKVSRKIQKLEAREEKNPKGSRVPSGSEFAFEETHLGPLCP